MSSMFDNADKLHNKAQQIDAGDGSQKKCDCVPKLVFQENPVKYRGHPKFYALLNEIAELHSKKNHDYAGKTKPLNNLMEVEDMGMDAWVGVCVRITDKYTRLKNFVKNRVFQFKAESFRDTLLDLAVYSLLTIILWEESNKDILEDPLERFNKKMHP